MHSLRWVGLRPWVSHQAKLHLGSQEVWAVTCAYSQLGDSCDLWGWNCSSILSLHSGTCAGLGSGHPAYVPTLRLQNAVVASPASGTHAWPWLRPSGMSTSEVTVTATAHPTMALIKVGSCSLHAHRSWVPMIMIFLASLGGPRLSLDSLSCVILAPSGYLHFHGSHPQSAPCILAPLKPEAQHPAPVWAGSLVSTNLLVNSLSFPFWGPVAIFPCWGSKTLLCPLLWGDFQVCGNFSLFTAPSPRCRSLSQFLCLFFSYTFALPHSVEINLPSWKSGVFCQCSVAVL